ncbi:MAG TPA: FKBP-type peptidyl-prolyl cis-trans isomerase [Candidatus Saccharimonadales bacterium]|nr:FKBP-type peptidyl-prolyl cis-trans isomerase [Candidatus Saccharimonadales bacterium]
MKDFLRRAMWGFMALLFVVTGVGVGIYYFWQATQQDNQSQAQNQDENKLAGKPLADFKPVPKVESLQKIDKKTGTGAEAKLGSNVTVIYTGAVAATGIVFDSSLDSGQPATFELKEVPGGLIKGWIEGLPGMKEGGERRLLIPAAMAYGANPPPGIGIPPNADLVFDVTLLAVK